MPAWILGDYEKPLPYLQCPEWVWTMGENKPIAVISHYDLGVICTQYELADLTDTSYVSLMRTVTPKNLAYLAIVDWLWDDTLMKPGQPQFWPPWLPMRRAEPG